MGGNNFFGRPAFRRFERNKSHSSEFGNIRQPSDFSRMRALGPVKVKTKDFKFAVFDIETENWTDFLVLGFYDGEQYCEFWDVKSFLEFLLTEKYSGYRIFAHFGGHFDFNFIIREIDENFQDYVYEIMSGQGISEVVVRRRGRPESWIFKDSFRLVPLSLEKLTKAFDVEHQKLAGEVDYKDMRKDMGRLRKYLEYDCLGLYEVIDKFRGWFVNYKVPLMSTIASQSMRTFQATMKRPILCLPPNIESFVRRSYFGGRVEIFKLRAWDNIYMYDVNCFDEETEILSFEGWKKWHELAPGIQLFTFNPVNSELEIKPARYVHLYDYSGEMVRISTENIDQFVTPNHRILQQTQDRSKKGKHYMEFPPLEVKGAVELEAPFRMPVCGEYDTGMELLDDAVFSLIGWVVTGGHFRQHDDSIIIGQSDKYNANMEDIASCLGKLGIKFSVKKNKRETSYKHYEFVIPAKYGRLLRTLLSKEIPAWILQTASKRQLSILYDAMVAGDGSRSNGKCSYVSFSRKLLEQFQEICFKVGLKCSIDYKNNVANVKEKRDGRYAWVTSKKQISMEFYEGKVWCVTVDNSFVVVRRNGKISISGNSLYPYVMQKYPMPIGKAKMVMHFDREHAGFYNARVKIPDMYVPPLPFVKSAKLLFPNGVLEGCYTSMELEMAEMMGCEVDVKYGCIFNTQFLFKDFISDMYDKKRNARDPVTKMIAKLIMNSSYGKFAQGRSKEKIIKCRDAFDSEGLVPYDRERGLFKVATESRATFIIPSIASWITSCARLELFSWLNINDGAHLYYCDTDSVVTDKPLPVGDSIGEMKLETEGAEAIFLQPKLYAIREQDSVKIKAKGFDREFVAKLSFRSFEKALEGDVSDFKQQLRRFAGLKESLKRNGQFVSMVDSVKSIQSKYSKREIIEDYDTRAWKLNVAH